MRGEKTGVCRVWSFSAAAFMVFAAVGAAAAKDYEVGPGKELAAISEVPWESLEAGDTVLIHWRPEAYHEKWVICRAGTAEKPITVRGVPGPEGQLPVIDGRNAVHRKELSYWNVDRALIKIGGARTPPDTMPAYIVVENLELTSARPAYVGMADDTERAYTKHASAIYIEKGEHITIRNCTMRDCGNGFFCAEDTSDCLVEGCYIVGNGIEGSIYEHNNYTEAHGLTFQYNRFGRLREGCGGNNLKDRSAGLVVRYNWIEGGNRQLDLVDGLVGDPRYGETFVYGNILIEHEGEGNRQMIHYGGDSGNTDRFRKGTLYLYSNTIISTREGRTTLVRLSSMDETCDMRNNIVYVTASGENLELIDDTGTLDMTHNWLKPGYRKGAGEISGTVNDDGTTIAGEEPGFVDAAAQDYHLKAGSPCIGASAPLAEGAKSYPVEFRYVKHRKGEPRPDREKEALDIGAY